MNDALFLINQFKAPITMFLNMKDVRTKSPKNSPPLPFPQNVCLAQPPLSLNFKTCGCLHLKNPTLSENCSHWTTPHDCGRLLWTAPYQYCLIFSAFHLFVKQNIHFNITKTIWKWGLVYTASTTERLTCTCLVCVRSEVQILDRLNLT